MNYILTKPVTRPSNIILNKCRCCLQERKDLHNHQGGSYIQLFRETLNIMLVSDARLPQWICSGCVNSLKEAKRFRDLVVAAENQLLQALSANTYLVPVTNNKPLQVVVCETEGASDIETDGDNEDYDPFQPDDNALTPDKADLKEIKNENEDIVVTIGSTIVKRLAAVRAGDAADEMETPVPDKSIITHRSDLLCQTNGWNRKEDNPTYKSSDSEPDTVTDIKLKQCYVKIDVMSENFIQNYISTQDTDDKRNDSKNDSGKRLPEKSGKLKPQTPKSITIRSNVIQDNYDNGRAKSGNTTKTRANILLLLKNSTIIPFRHSGHYINEFKCFYCQNTYRIMKELRKHTESQHVGKVTDQNISSGISQGHASIYADISRLKCRECKKEVTTIETLIDHLTNVHKKVYLYHDKEKRSRGIIGFDFGTEELKCHLCDKKFVHFRELSSHMNEHFGDHVCVICGKRFMSWTYYKLHMKRHGSKRVECDKCGATFATKRTLIFHLGKNHFFPFKGDLKCNLCSVTFGFKEYERRAEHMRKVHSIGKRLYTCGFCNDGENYKERYRLYYHVRTVHADLIGENYKKKVRICKPKNYQCDFCGKIFTNRNVLKFHVRIHLNDKRNKCVLCDAAFIQRHRLKSHYKSMHPDSDFISLNNIHKPK